MVQTRPFRSGIPNVWWAFMVIILGFVLSNAVSLYEMRNSQAQVRLITKHAATNIEIAARLSRDLDRKRSLIENHILEQEMKDMDRIQAELAGVDSDVAAALRSYESMLEDPDERDAWQMLESGIAAIAPPIIRAMSLSRRNLDAEAQTIIMGIDARFDSIDQAMSRLLHLNHARADQEAAQVRALQSNAALVLVVLTVIWAGFAFVTARWVSRLIRDREGQMRQTMALLEERNRELDAFAGRVAHDIRGPLTTINLAASQLIQRVAPGESAGNILRRGVTRIESMIQDLLALSRVGAQTIGATCDMQSVVGATQEDLSPEVDAVGGLLQIAAAPAKVACNGGLLRQAFWNLGENAVKYRRPGVQLKIEIEGTCSAETYKVIFSDNGTGMPTWVVRQAFEPFFRGKQAESVEGSGLGLSVVKRVIEACGGTVSVDSELGRGTIFTISLPLATSEAA